jgi:hypothetical protein
LPGAPAQKGNVKTDRDEEDHSMSKKKDLVVEEPEVKPVDKPKDAPKPKKKKDKKKKKSTKK